MSNELMQALIDLEKERGIPKAALIEAIRLALNTAYKKNFGTSQNIIVEMNEITGAVQVYSQKQVVAEVKDKSAEISLDEASQINPDAQLDEIINIEITPPILAASLPRQPNRWWYRSFAKPSAV